MKNLKFLIIILIMGMLFPLISSEVKALVDNFDVRIVNYPSSVKQGQTFDVDVRVTNREGSTGTKFVELGMYKKSTVDMWYGTLAVVKNAKNCEDEPNVQTKIVGLSGYDSTTVTFSIVAPSTDSSERYVLHANAFDCCYKDCGLTTGTGSSDHDIISIDLTGTQIVKGCDSTQWDPEAPWYESDTDCGGQCSPCRDGYRCSSDSDCKSNYCTGGVCMSGGKDPDRCTSDKIIRCPDGSAITTDRCISGKLQPTGATCKDPVAPPSIFAYNIDVEVDDSKITTSFLLKNNGGDMTESWLIEIQPRPKGQLPLAMVGAQRACDSDYPENVHREFRLDGEEEVRMELSSFVEDGEYDVYGITVDKCWADKPQGNIKYPPFGAGILLDKVKVGTGVPSPSKCEGIKAVHCWFVDVFGSLAIIMEMLLAILIAMLIYYYAYRR